MDHWYFAYGSNLLSDQMVARTGPIRTGDDAPRIACLPDYRLAFNMRGDDGQIYANLVQPGDGVLGVVYRCDREALEKLDNFEAGYERQEVVVIDDNGVELEAFVYIARPECVTAELPPSAAYLQQIVTGSRAHGLRENYIHAIGTTTLGRDCGGACDTNPLGLAVANVWTTAPHSDVISSPAPPGIPPSPPLVSHRASAGTGALNADPAAAQAFESHSQADRLFRNATMRPDRNQLARLAFVAGR